MAHINFRKVINIFRDTSYHLLKAQPTDNSFRKAKINNVLPKECSFLYMFSRN